MRNLLRATGIFGFFFVYHLAAAYAATAHLPENYFYQRADVTGDGRDELIAQPARAGDEAYVLFATGADSWEGVWQRLNDIDPRLAWDSESATLIVGDFNGDGRDDLYVQARAPGSAHALLLADESGQFTQIHHLFSDSALVWNGMARHAGCSREISTATAATSCCCRALIPRMSTSSSTPTNPRISTPVA